MNTLGGREMLRGTSTATGAEQSLALNLWCGSQRVDELAELLAGHPGQFGVLQ